MTGVNFIERDGARESALYLMWNRGKRSLAIDMRQADGVEAIRRIAPSVNVVVENYRPGVADRIGIGYDDLSAINDRIVYCSISAFGKGRSRPTPARIRWCRRPRG